MNQLMMFSLGLIIGIVIGVLGSNFSRTSKTKYQVQQDFATMEDMFEQFMGELEGKYQAILAEITEQEGTLKELYRGVLVTEVTEQITEDDSNKESPKVTAIRQLLNQGCSAETVAKQLGIGQGEVLLMMELEKIQKGD